MEFSGYFTGNRAADAACDKEDGDEYCCCCLVCMQTAMVIYSPLFLCSALHPKYTGCRWTLEKWHLFLGNISPSSL